MEYFTTAVTVLSGMAVILTFWNKWIYKPTIERKERKDQERSDRLISSMEKMNQPHLSRLAKLEDDQIDLKELVAQSLNLHEQHEENFRSLDKRVFRLEVGSDGVRKTINYAEEYGRVDKK